MCRSPPSLWAHTHQPQLSEGCSSTVAPVGVFPAHSAGATPDTLSLKHSVPALPCIPDLCRGLSTGPAAGGQDRDEEQSACGLASGLREVGEPSHPVKPQTCFLHIRLSRNHRPALGALGLSPQSTLQTLFQSTLQTPLPEHTSSPSLECFWWWGTHCFTDTHSLGVY